MLKSKMAAPVLIAVIVVALAIVGFAYWRSQPKAAPVDDKGIPLVPPESRREADKMRQMFQSGALRPPTTQPAGPPGAPPTAPTLPSGP